MIRILIWLPVYALIVITLPSLPAVRDVIDPLYQIEIKTSALICAGCLAVSLGALIALNRTRRGLFNPQAPAASMIGSYIIFGLFVSAAWGLFEYVSNQPPALEYLVLMPLAFALSELAVTAIPRRRSAPAKVSGPPPSKLLRRLLIWPPAYGAVVFLLPMQPEIERLLAPLDLVHPATRLWLAVGALLLAGVAVLVPLRFIQTSSGPDENDVYRRWRFHMLVAGALGLAFAAVLGLFAHVSGSQVSLPDLVLVPLGFALAEGMVLAISHRIDHGPFGQ